MSENSDRLLHEVWRRYVHEGVKETGLHYTFTCRTEDDVMTSDNGWDLYLDAIRGRGKDVFYRRAHVHIDGRELLRRFDARDSLIPLVIANIQLLLDKVHDAEDTLVLLARQATGENMAAVDVLFDALAESGRVQPVDMGEDRREQAIEANRRTALAWARAILAA